MLKWTVGPKPTSTTPGASVRTTSLSVGPCLNIRRAAARLHLRRSAPSTSVSVRRANIRSLKRGKENDGYHSDGLVSPRTRDSVYMRLDSLPAALRDVSNRLGTPVTTPGSPAPKTTGGSAGGKRTRSRSKPRHARSSLASRLSNQRTNSATGPNEVVTSPLTHSQLCDTPVDHGYRTHSTLPANTAIKSDESFQNCFNKSLAKTRLSEKFKSNLDPDFQIDYSPCPIRATKSLVALRRRLTDAFITPTLSVGAMPSFDNPLYFVEHQVTQIQTTKSLDKINVDDGLRVPCGMSSERTVRDITVTPTCHNSQELSSKRVNSEPESFFEEKPIGASGVGTALSPLTRHLSSLNLNTAKQVLPPKTIPHLRSSCTFKNPNLYPHDVTDPKFLSLFSAMDSPSVALNLAPRVSHSRRVQICTKPDNESDNLTKTDSIVNTSFTIDNCLYEPCFPSTKLNSDIRKRNSVRRERTVSENGPPLKAQPILLANGHLAMPATNHNALRGNSEETVLIETPPKDASCIRLPAKRRRKRDRRRTKSVGGDDIESLIGVGDGVFAGKNCDSIFNDNVELASLDSSQEEEFNLKRQGCIRRRPRHFFGNENQDPNSMRNSQFGMTLPLGLPSPFSPEYALAWYSKMQNGPHAFPNITLQRNYSISKARNAVPDTSSLTRNATPWPHQSETITSSQATMSDYIDLQSESPNIWSNTKPTPPVVKSDSKTISGTTRFSNSTFLETHFDSRATTNFISESNFITKSTHCFNTSTGSDMKLGEIFEGSERFGLTLSKGIPSPPTPILPDSDIPGIKPLTSEDVSMDVNETWKSNIDDNSVWKSNIEDNIVWKTNPEDQATWKSSVDDHGVWKTNTDDVAKWKRTTRSLQDDDVSSSDETWNSHCMNFLNASQMLGSHMNEEGMGANDNSSQMNYADNIDKDSFVSIAPSPQAVVERRSRSRRCLRFTSPGGSARQRRTSRRLSSSKRSVDENLAKGELDLAIYENSGLITVHVIAGKNLHKSGGRTSNAYVKVALVPSSEERTFHRTAVYRDSSAPRFDQKFSFELLDSDLDKRVLVSVWHRDKERRRSEFLGCMSFGVKHAVKKEVSGSFRLLSQSAGACRSQNVSAAGYTDTDTAVMARHSDSSVEEVISLEESVVQPTPATERRRAPCPPKKSATKTTAAANNEDSSFLRHLELEPAEAEAAVGADATATTSAMSNYNQKGGRTPFTTTKQLTRQGGAGFGFSIAWTQPPRIERVEPGQPADKAGLKPGDYVIFVDTHNVVTLPEEEILRLIRLCGNRLTLEVYRRAATNGLVRSDAAAAAAAAAAAGTTLNKHRASITCSAATTTSLDLSKRRLHLPQVTFSSEVGSGVIV